ncbi:MAG: endo-1,4-beta-xylanase [Phycisphaerales bacterium]|nr:endo-1,4-beta-xylanase [Phycisphaerales bacterium]
MLRFAVFDDHGPARDWPMHDVVLIGKGDVVVPGTVRFDPETSCIECEPEESGAVALGILHDTGSMGTLALRTCLLPHAAQPYILTAELARRAIGQFLTKAEEWHMASMADEVAAFDHWEQSRGDFTKAMVSEDSLHTATQAQSCLERAVDASERLAIAHAEVLLKRRYAERPASSTAMGCRVQPQRCTGGLQKVLASHFGLVVLPLQWKDLCPAPGEYNWDAADAWMEWAIDTKRRVVIGPMIDLEPGKLPPWSDQWSSDYHALRDAAYEHVEKIVQRYGDAVGMWNLVSGMEAGATAVATEREMVDLVRTLALLVRSAHRGRRVVVEVARPWGHYRAKRPMAPPPLHFVSRLVQSGIRLDAVGIRLLQGGTTGSSTRDAMAICTMLDQLMKLDVPVLLSAAGVPDGPVAQGRGSWRGAWSPKRQAAWAGVMAQVALARPYIESFIWGDLYDTAEAHPPTSGLISTSGKAKPALQKLAQIRQRLRTPLADEAST